MYKYSKQQKSKLKCNDGYTGESIEKKIRRILNNKEPITDGAPIIYTERKDGIQAAYDIRTDRWEVAVEAMDKVSKHYLAKREERMKAKEMGEQAKEGMKKEGGAQPIPTTN